MKELVNDDINKAIISALAWMVIQNCIERDGVFEASFLRTHKNALMILVKVGIMEDMDKENKWDETWERIYFAKFKPNWENDLNNR